MSPQASSATDASFVVSPVAVTVEMVEITTAGTSELAIAVSGRQTTRIAISGIRR
jgi:hypothetical protein